MFGFLKPEVSGLKNVLNAYFKYKNQFGIMTDLNSDELRGFADWYYCIRLGPQMMGVQSEIKIKIARERFDYLSRDNQGPTIMTVLQGLLIAEGKDAASTMFFDHRALARLRDKFPPISDKLMGS